jgi:uncharacterized protein YciI
MEPLVCWLYRFTPTRPAMLREGLNERELAAFQRHAAYLNDLEQRGVIIAVGRALVADERNFALAIIKATSEDAARGVMEHDPFVTEGVVRAELFPFQLSHLSAANAGLGAQPG